MASRPYTCKMSCPAAAIFFPNTVATLPVPSITTLNIFSLMVLSFYHGNEGKVVEYFFGNGSIDLFGEPQHTLHMAFAYGYHHFSVHFQLVDQFGGNIRSGGGNDRLVEWSIRRQSFIPIPIKIFYFRVLAAQHKIAVVF